MRKILSVLIISLLTGEFIQCQSLSETYQIKKDKYLGISTGLYLSNFVMGKEWAFAHYHTLEATFEDKYTAGINIGFFRERSISDVFSFQPEIYFNQSKHRINYKDWSRNGIMGTVRDADYSVSFSRINLSILPKLSLGENHRFRILAGPYLNLPVLIKHKGSITTKTWNEQTTELVSSSSLNDNNIKDDINTIFGGLISFRLDFPVEKNFVSTEFRMGKSFNHIVELPNIKESFIIFNLIYLLKLN